MEKSLKTEKRKYIISIIVIATILFTNLVIENADYIKYVYVVAVISLVYTIHLIIENPKIISYILSSYSFYWIVGFAIIMFLYGNFGENKAEYSLQFHVLNIFWIMMLLIILHNNSHKIVDTMAKSSSLVIIAMTLFIVITNSFSLLDIFTYGGKVIGFTAVGNQNTTAMSYIFLVIPLIYKVVIDKDKRYIWVSLIGIVFMLLTGSKKSIISLIIMIIVMGIGKSTNIKKLLKNIFIIGIAIGIIAIMCYYVPTLHSLIWERLEQMIISLDEFNTTDQSSTALRTNFIITAFTKGWDKPILGHGWGSFAPMYGYSPLYDTYLYTHNNYAEIFFSFGLMGLFIYYWFPVRIIIKTMKNKDNNKKTFCALYILVLLFLDFGAVCCYSSILPYIGFVVTGFILREQKTQECFS